MVKAVGKADLVLRPFAAADFGAVQGWFRNPHEARLWGGPLVRFPIDDAQLARMLCEAAGPDPRKRCWSAVLNGELVGHAQTVRGDESSVRLARIAVSPDRRREGIGRALVSRVIDEILSDPSVRHVTLNVYADNDDACRLYRELGFIDADCSASQDMPQRRSMLLERSRWASQVQ